MPTKNQKPTLQSLSILLILPLAIFAFYNPVIKTLFPDKNTATVEKEENYVCTPFNNNSAGPMVILRLDDVQAFSWSDISIKMMEDALASGLPIVAGVIPKNISEDKKTIEFLKRNDCNIQIAVHGYDHGPSEYDNETSGEFAHLDKIETQQRLALAKEEIAKIATSESYVFIPPQNELSAAARTTLGEEGFSVISSEGTGYYDYDAASWSFKNKSFISASQTILDCITTFNEGDDLCVIMLHPQDYTKDDQTIDESLYNEYKKILSYLNTEDISVVTYAEVKP